MLKKDFISLIWCVCPIYWWSICIRIFGGVCESEVCLWVCLPDFFVGVNPVRTASILLTVGLVWIAQITGGLSASPRWCGPQVSSTSRPESSQNTQHQTFSPNKGDVHPIFNLSYLKLHRKQLFSVIFKIII